MTQTINDARELAERWSSAFTQADMNALMALFAPNAFETILKIVYWVPVATCQY